MIRLPAIPIMMFDPYISVWMPADTLTETDSAHWCGQKLPIRGKITVDGKAMRFMGEGEEVEMKLKDISVTPLSTVVEYEDAGVKLKISFTVPFLPDDLDRASTPICLIQADVSSGDGKEHSVKTELSFSDRLCYNAEEKPEIACYPMFYDDLKILEIGQIIQKILSHSGDSVTIDWGYLLLGSSDAELKYENGFLSAVSEFNIAGETKRIRVQAAYDDIASILYFGTPCKAWYARSGMTIVDAMRKTQAEFDYLIDKCAELDKALLQEAHEIGGEDYVKLVSASWRHVFAAHKLIADTEGKPVFISKENNSNGCAGTVDVSYPSTPMFLRFCPELVNAMCRPVLKFSRMDVWSSFDFAPHDVGRYPIVTGQVYGNDGTMDVGRRPAYQPPFYLMPAEPPRYRFDRQMPVEESGNMLIMLYAAAHYGADKELIEQNLDTCAKWVKYLIDYGADPGEQLCTDDFAGHMAHNVNLSAKAIVGIACYGRMLEMVGQDGSEYAQKAKEMAKDWLKRCESDEGTYLSFEKKGWSMKYNLAWDKALGLDLMDEEFYDRETKSYLKRINEFGLPLDNRATYTKSDWELWCAALATDEETRKAIIKPVVNYLEKTESRVAFSDWYDTITGKHVQFKARSVQGGLYMPFLCKK